MLRFLSLCALAITSSSLTVAQEQKFATVAEVDMSNKWIRRDQHYLDQAPASDSVVQLSRMASDEVIIIESSSLGCFHSSEAKYTFKSNSIVDPEFGNAFISEDEIAALDRYLRIAASNLDSCTTVETYTIKVLQAGVITRQETYIDGACVGSLYRQPLGAPFLLSPADLHRRVSQRYGVE